MMICRLFNKYSSVPPHTLIRNTTLLLKMPFAIVIDDDDDKDDDDDEDGDGDGDGDGYGDDDDNVPR